MRKISFLIISLGVFMLCAIVTGCDTPQSSGKHVRNHDELILAIGGEPDTGFDPTTGWGRYGSPLFQSTLLKRDDDLRIVNDLATEYDVSHDGKVWIFKLRSDVLFSDGYPLTAEDVKFTFATTASNSTVIDLTNMANVEAPDNYTVKFTLKEPQSTFINMVVSTGIIPKHAYGNNYAQNPIGSGPYRLVQWDKGQQVIVEANEQYYGSKPFFRKITFLFLNEDAAFAAAKVGQTDISFIPSTFSKQSVTGMHLVKLQSVDNRGILFPYVKSSEKTPDGRFIGNDVTADVAIRKAINIALDRQALVEGILEGNGTPAYTLNDGLPWFNLEAVIHDADMEEAKKLLDRAGWTVTDGDGVRLKGSLRAEFNLIYPANDVTRQSLSIAVADMIKPLGIRIHVEGRSWDEIEKLMHSNAVMFGWGSHDPLEMYHVYSSKYQGVEYYNPGFYSNAIVDDYLNEAMAALDEETAIHFWKKAQWDGQTGISARGDAPWAWLVNIDHLFLLKDGLNIGKQRIQPHGHGWPITANIESWHWSE